MDERLSVTQIAVLVAYAAAMTGGQLLFKLAAVTSGTAGNLQTRLFGLLGNRFFLSAVVLYIGLTVLWVWILTFTPLSRAYAFVALAFVFTPLAGATAFGEPISLRVVIGIALVVLGLFCVAG